MGGGASLTGNHEPGQPSTRYAVVVLGEGHLIVYQIEAGSSPVYGAKFISAKCYGSIPVLDTGSGSSTLPAVTTIYTGFVYRFRTLAFQVGKTGSIPVLSAKFCSDDPSVNTRV